MEPDPRRPEDGQAAHGEGDGETPAKRRPRYARYQNLRDPDAREVFPLGWILLSVAVIVLVIVVASPD